MKSNTLFTGIGSACHAAVPDGYATVAYRGYACRFAAETFRQSPEGQTTEAG